MIISFDRIDLNYGQNWDEHIKNIPKNESLIFWDEMHCDRLEPLSHAPTGWNELYKIYTTDLDRDYVYYVTSDFNIKWQSEKLKKVISDIKTDIKFLIHPYTMPFDEYFHLDNGVVIKIMDNKIFVKGKTREYQYKYNFCSLNGTRKDHRARLVRDIHDVNNLIYSYYPFEDRDQLEETFDIADDKKYLKELTEFNEIYDEEIFSKVLDKPLRDQTKVEITDKMNSKWEAFQSCVPVEYVQSCADLVSDAFVEDGLSFTEKTWKPVLLKKPYILMSGRNVHTSLQRMGYELYTELFDYSFDGKDFDDRYESIVKQVKNLCQLSVKDFSKEVKGLSDKVEYNYQHFNSEISKWRALNDTSDEEFLNFLIDNQYDDNIFS